MKKKGKKKKIKIWVILLFIAIIFSICGYITYKKVSTYSFKPGLKEVEINTKHKISEFIKAIKNAEIVNKDEEKTFSKLGEEKIKIVIKNKVVKNKEEYIKVKVVDTINPEIEAKDNYSINVGDQIDLLKEVVVTDNSKEEIKAEIVGEYNPEKAGTYNLKYKATDSSNNSTEKELTLVVKEKPKQTTTTKVSSSSKYYIKVNLTQNVVMVYQKDDNGQYTILVKTFVASVGDGKQGVSRYTPVGKFTVGAKYEQLSLKGGVWGHYTTQIYKAIWFHSVPYYSKPDKQGNWNNLEYEEYNKLGSPASAGCVRLAVRDSKWIYDNIPKGTTVEVYESASLPEGVTKPAAIKIDVNDTEKRGWDPTDTNPNNPWNK
jgi:lipoprotein-anchoring transpeptidase ErfK/SrfK